LFYKLFRIKFASYGLRFMWFLH